MKKNIQELSPMEILALAIHIEKENQKAFISFSEMFEGYDEDVVLKFKELSKEESLHEAVLSKKFTDLFGDAKIPEITEFDVEEVVEAFDIDDSEHLIFDSLKSKKIYQLALAAEKRAFQFYLNASQKVKNSELSKLFKELSELENSHSNWIEEKLKQIL
jgi:rubrerythrin